MKALKKIAAVSMAVACLAVVCSAQDGSGLRPQSGLKGVRRIKIQHADPMFIYMILRGQIRFDQGPEMSTLTGGGFGSGLNNNSGNGGFGSSGLGSGSGLGSNRSGGGAGSIG